MMAFESNRQAFPAGVMYGKAGAGAVVPGGAIAGHADGKGPTAAGKVVCGGNTVCVRAGKYKVQIFGYRKTGERQFSAGDPNSPLRDILEQIVPERYNSAATLNCEVQGGHQEANFSLDAK